jgi:hypothetical protein
VGLRGRRGVRSLTHEMPDVAKDERRAEERAKRDTREHEQRVRADDGHGEENRVSGFWGRQWDPITEGRVWTHGSMRRLRNPHRSSRRVYCGSISFCSGFLSSEAGIRSGVIGVEESLTPLRTPEAPTSGRRYTSGSSPRGSLPTRRASSMVAERNAGRLAPCDLGRAFPMVCGWLVGTVENTFRRMMSHSRSRGDKALPASSA